MTVKLSDFERLSLANQFRIRAILEPNEKDHLTYCAEVLENGYEYFYGKVFGHVSDTVSATVANEVADILDMYRVIARALKDGLTKSNDSFVTFQGFDGNHDEHYGLASFWISQPGSWDEHKQTNPLNSHSQGTLPCYRRMLKKWESMGKPMTFNQTQLDEIVGASHFGV